MPTGDAVQAVPTAAEEMAKFESFTTNDGATVDPKTENLNPVTGAPSNDGGKTAAKAAEPAKETVKAAALTDEEADKVITDAETKKGSELTDEETAKALQDARDAKLAPKDAPRRSVQERITKAVRGQRAAEDRASAAERRADALEARLTALEKGEKAPLTGEAKAAPNANAAPDPKDFTYGELDADYIRALARHETRLEMAEDRAKQSKTQTDAEHAKVIEKVTADVKAFEEAGATQFDDFEEVVIQGARDAAWPLSASLGAALLESDHGPAIAYSLASDVKLAKEIAALSPNKQVAWLGRQEAKLDAGSGDEGKAAGAKSEDGDGTTPPVTKAPTPVSRARGAGAPAQSQSSGSDFASFEREAMAK
jgi:hypothetical protein